MVNKLIPLVLVVCLAILWGTILLFSPFSGTGLFFSMALLSFIWILFFKRPLLFFCFYFLLIVNLDNFVLTDNPIRITADVVFTSILMVMLILFFLVRKERIEYAPLHIFYLITLVPCFVSIFVSLNPLVSAKFFFRLVSYLLISVGVFNTVTDKKDFRKILTFMALSAVIPCLFGYLQYFGISTLGIVTYSGGTMEMGDVTTQRIGSTLVHPVYFGLFLTIIIPIVVHLFQTVYKEKILLFLCVILALVSSSILTLARSPWIALLISVIAYCILTKKIKILLFICCTALILYFFPLIHARWADVAATHEVSSFDWRIDMWRSVLNLFFSKKQWVFFGVGLNEFGDLSKLVGYRHSAHNDYIQSLVDTGVWGLLSYGLFLSYIPFALWRISRRMKDFELRNFVLWALSLDVGLLFFRITNSIQPSQYVYYFTLLTLAFKIDKLTLTESTGVSTRTIIKETDKGIMK